VTVRTLERTPRRSAAQREALILLGDDGRHVLLGRHGEPDAGEMARIAALLTASGHGGWVARLCGDYWHRTQRVTLERVQDVAPTTIPFSEAVEAFQTLRRGALAP